MNSYIQYYGLSVNPFDIFPDPKFFFPSETHKEALASLFYVIKERKGFMLIIGKDGSGKTILVNQLIKSLDKNVNAVYFPQGNLSFEQMLKDLLTKLELPLEKTSKGAMVHQLNEHLIQNLVLGKNLILIIDEAQDISDDVMEELRLTSNLETSTSKLLQIIFVGQPKLETKLKTKELRQLKQRIAVISRITRLSLTESMKYIDHRLMYAGCHSNILFLPEALALICKYANGIPLKINILCHNALLRGFERSEKPVSASTVRKVRKEDNLLEASTRHKQKPNFIFLNRNNLLKRSLYFFMIAACIMIAFFSAKKYINKTYNIQQLAYYIKPSAVSKKITAKIPNIEEKVTPETSVIKQDSVSKIAPAAYSDSTFSELKPSETADFLKPSIPSATDRIHYKKIVNIKQGATLYSLILNNYNYVNTTMIDLIMLFNPDIANPDLILTNSKIRMPEITESNLIVKLSDGSTKAHLGTFSTRQEALIYKNVINHTDIVIEFVLLKVSPDKTWFRVMAGPFAKEEECLKAIQLLKQNGLLPAFGNISKM